MRTACEAVRSLPFREEVKWGEKGSWEGREVGMGWKCGGWRVRSEYNCSCSLYSAFVPPLSSDYVGRDDAPCHSSIPLESILATESKRAFCASTFTSKRMDS